MPNDLGVAHFTSYELWLTDYCYAPNKAAQIYAYAFGVCVCVSSFCTNNNTGCGIVGIRRKEYRLVFCWSVYIHTICIGGVVQE